MALAPLFPLPRVLFPDTPLPLHIFEPRYKEMIGECLDLKQPFAVVRALENEFARAGCTAEIIEVTKRYDDGRLDILTVGQRRFEVVSVDDQRSFLRAELSYFDDDPAPPPSATERERAVRLQRELLALANEDARELPEDHPQLSFQLAGPMPLDLDFKQALLLLRSESGRLQSLAAYYEALLPRLRHALKTRSKAAGNGHAGRS